MAVKKFTFLFTLADGTTHRIPIEIPVGEPGGYYIPTLRQVSDTEIEVSYTPSNPGMPSVKPVIIDVDLTGYATEQWVKNQKYLTAVPEGYAKTSDIPKKPEDIGAQPAGNYLTEVPDGYATEKFVTDKIAEAELNAEDGQDGATFTPFVDADGNLSWSNDKGLDNPETVNIKGETPEVRILQAMRSGTSGVKYGVQIEGPKIVDGNGNIISNSGTVWDGADGKPGTAIYIFDPDKALSGDGVIDTSFVNVPTGSYIKQSDLLLAPNGDVYIYEVQANSSGIILKKKATFLFSIAGKNGDDGITPHIGENGNWWIGEKDTGIFAGGQGSGEDVDLTGYATEQWVKDQKYLTAVPEGYAKTSDIPTKPEDIGAQPTGNYLTKVPDGYATETFVTNKISESAVTVDTKLSTTSANPVQNKVIAQKFDSIKRRISEVAFNGTTNPIAYYEIGRMMNYSSGDNRGSIIFMGRLGHWIASSIANFNILLSNRSGVKASVFAQGNVAGALNCCDIEIYRQSDNSDIIYMKTNMYWVMDLEYIAHQHTVNYINVPTTPTGELVWKLSENPIISVDFNGDMTAAGLTVGDVKISDLVDRVKTIEETDYLTEDDRKSLVDDVLAALPAAEGGSF